MCPLDNMFVHDTDTFHCVTVDISVANCEYFNGASCCFTGVL